MFLYGDLSWPSTFETPSSVFPNFPNDRHKAWAQQQVTVLAKLCFSTLPTTTAVFTDSYVV